MRQWHTSSPAAGPSRPIAFGLGRRDVDLIARRGRILAFIEVKTRRGSEFGSPAAGGWAPQTGSRSRQVADIWRIRFAPGRR